MKKLMFILFVSIFLTNCTYYRSITSDNGKVYIAADTGIPLGIMSVIPVATALFPASADFDYGGKVVECDTYKSRCKDVFEE